LSVNSNVTISVAGFGYTFKLFSFFSTIPTLVSQFGVIPLAEESDKP